MNKKAPVFAVVMAGGRGERFWPLSTTKHPKQFLSLFSGEPMIRTSVERVFPLIPPERVLVVTSEALVPATRKALPMLPAGNIIGEPMGRDTAAACMLGTAVALSRDPEAICCILTADHLIEKKRLFLSILGKACAAADAADILVTLGIKPSYPSTGFGYIHAGPALFRSSPAEFRKAIKFVEKPDAKTARAYLARGSYYWNSGMFIWRAETFFRSLEKLAPPLYRLGCLVRGCRSARSLENLMKKEYPKLERISVDYAIMEKSGNIVVVPADFGWNDVGSWAALNKCFKPDQNGNIAKGDVQSLDAGNNIVLSPNRLTALLGVEDLIVVQAENVTLVCHRSRAEQVKKLVAQIQANGGFNGVL
jgi:mannose-1-phosphate guanylyltransferase